MSTWLWLPAAISLIGAGLAYLGAWSGARQRDRAGRREEWGRRFTAALGAIASERERERVLGGTLLVDLSRSELASHEETQLADHLLAESVQYERSEDAPRDAGTVDKTRATTDNDEQN